MSAKCPICHNEYFIVKDLRSTERRLEVAPHMQEYYKQNTLKTLPKLYPFVVKVALQFVYYVQA